jgi:hypothetical protein
MVLYGDLSGQTVARGALQNAVAQAFRKEQVGGGGPSDFSAVAQTGHVSEAQGSFDAGTVVSSECTVQCPMGVCPTNPTCAGAPANTYSLQLNTKPFTTQTCNGCRNFPSARLEVEQWNFIEISPFHKSRDI